MKTSCSSAATTPGGLMATPSGWAVGSPGSTPWPLTRPSPPAQHHLRRTNGYPVDGLVFQSSAFADPQGAGTFAALQWRVAEVLTPAPRHQTPPSCGWTGIRSGIPAKSPSSTNTWVCQRPSCSRNGSTRTRPAQGHDRTVEQLVVPHEFRPHAVDIASALRRGLVFPKSCTTRPVKVRSTATSSSFSN